MYTLISQTCPDLYLCSSMELVSEPPLELADKLGLHYHGEPETLSPRRAYSYIMCINVSCYSDNMAWILLLNSNFFDNTYC